MEWIYNTTIDRKGQIFQIQIIDPKTMSLTSKHFQNLESIATNGFRDYPVYYIFVF